MTRESCQPVTTSVFPLPQRTKLSNRSKRVCQSLADHDNDIQFCQIVEASGLPNFQACKILLKTHLCLENWELRLKDYHDEKLIDLLKYGFPISFEGDLVPSNKVIVNHKGAIDYPEQIDKYLLEELALGAVMGPFDNSPFEVPCKISPLNTIEKKDSEKRRVILDLSFPSGQSVNEGIPKQQYLGEHIDLKFPSVDALCSLIHKKERAV